MKNIIVIALLVSLAVSIKIKTQEDAFHHCIHAKCGKEYDACSGSKACGDAFELCHVEIEKLNYKELLPTLDCMEEHQERISTKVSQCIKRNCHDA